MSLVMRVVIQTVNYIRSHVLSHRQFKEFLKELDSEYGNAVNLLQSFQMVKSWKMFTAIL